MKRISFRSKNRQLIKKVERVVAETVIHRRPLQVTGGSWPFVVFGPDERGQTVVRAGSAEQAKIMSAPLYIATLGGENIPQGSGLPIEELANGDFPEELAGLKVVHLSPLRPLSVASKRIGPTRESALSELVDFYKHTDIAIIETPDEGYWALSALKYLDETDRFFPDPVLVDFYSRLGHTLTGPTCH